MWSTRKVDYATIQLEPETKTGLVQAKTKNGVELDWNQIVYLCAKTKILNKMKKKNLKKKTELHTTESKPITILLGILWSSSNPLESELQVSTSGHPNRRDNIF